MDSQINFLALCARRKRLVSDSSRADRARELSTEEESRVVFSYRREVN